MAANDLISTGFDEHIVKLRLENRFGTAESYTTAKNKFEEFSPKLKYADTTPVFLKEFENWLLENNKSISTVGIYIRSLRTIFNNAIFNGIIDNSIYPFGKRKYIIPTSRNNKRALPDMDILKILTYKAIEKSPTERSIDFWIFSYLSNGINMKDVLRLKWCDLGDSTFSYVREKTKRTKRTNEPIQVILKDKAFDIIQKWGFPSENKNDYIFPFLRGVPANSEEERNKVKEFTKSINKYLKKVGEELSLPFKLTTYVSRHTFATLMIKNGADLATLKSLLGHSSIITTEKYVGTLPLNDLVKLTDKLMQF